MTISCTNPSTKNELLIVVNENPGTKTAKDKVKEQVIIIMENYRKTIEQRNLLITSVVESVKTIVHGCKEGILLQREYWFEMLDPEHRYVKRSTIYQSWLDQPDTDKRIVSLFEWLKTNHSKLNLKNIGRVQYLTPAERDPYRVMLEGKIRLRCDDGQKCNFYRIQRFPIGKTHTHPHSYNPKQPRVTTYLIVMDSKNNIYLCEPHINEDGHHFHHSSFLSGKAVSFAGMISFIANRLAFISNDSGHYAPTKVDFFKFLRFLEGEGVDLSNVSIEVYTKDEKSLCINKEYTDATRFLQKNEEKTSVHLKKQIEPLKIPDGLPFDFYFEEKIDNEKIYFSGIAVMEKGQLKNITESKFLYNFKKFMLFLNFLKDKINLSQTEFNISFMGGGRTENMLFGRGGQIEKGNADYFFRLAESLDKDEKESFLAKMRQIRTAMREEENKKNSWPLPDSSLPKGFTQFEPPISNIRKDGIVDLHYLAASDRSFEEFQKVLQGTVDCNILSSNGDTPLMILCSKANVDVRTIKLFLDKGAQVNIKNRCEFSALYQACKAGNLEVVKLLVAAGAEFGAREINVADFLKHAEIKDFLILNKL